MGRKRKRGGNKSNNDEGMSRGRYYDAGREDEPYAGRTLRLDPAPLSEDEKRRQRLAALERQQAAQQASEKVFLARKKQKEWEKLHKDELRAAEIAAEEAAMRRRVTADLEALAVHRAKEREERAGRIDQEMKARKAAFLAQLEAQGNAARAAPGASGGRAAGAGPSMAATAGSSSPAAPAPARRHGHDLRYVEEAKPVAVGAAPRTVHVGVATPRVNAPPAAAGAVHPVIDRDRARDSGASRGSVLPVAVPSPAAAAPSTPGPGPAPLDSEQQRLAARERMRQQRDLFLRKLEAQRELESAHDAATPGAADGK